LRRKDKEIRDKNEIELIINKANVCRIALSDNNMPYVVPVNFGYRDKCFYVHSATEGKKIEIIKKNNNVCFELDIGHQILQGNSTCSTTMKYFSVIGYGKAYIIDDFEEKTKALKIIVDHYIPDTTHKYPEKLLKKLVIIKIEINKMTGKKSGY
jgi:nitroimidazol reductase NimA-like FMN-containing flavoprotein (pyridoxamine 5'-phosphate oxidase superfamily)